MKQLIVNADDFGLTPGINRGILDGHRTGIITSTTVMTNCPAAPAGLEQALAQAPGLGLGVHLCLTAGRPVSPLAAVPSLVKEDGQFYHISQWAGAASQFDPDDLRRELDAQFERFISLAGKLPDHLDSHHHAAYLHPAALEAILDIADKNGLPLRNVGLDAPPQAANALLHTLMPTVPQDVAIRWIERLQAASAQHPGPFFPARFEAGFYGARATLGDLLLILTDLPEDSITELMCHPGYVDEALAGSSYTTRREDELSHLMHKAARECIRDEGIGLIHFGNLSRS